MKYKYEKAKDFIKSTKTSRATIHRFYKKFPDLFGETIKKKVRRYYPVSHVKYFNRENLVDEVRLLELENNSMRNIIDNLMDRDSLQTKLWEMDWSFFGTIAYSSDLSKKVCYRLMCSMYEKLEKKYGDETEIRLFFTTEPFRLRDGHHNHFVIYMSSAMCAGQIIDDIEDFFNYDRVDLVAYDKYKAGLFYMTKQGLVNEDWDILGNNLTKDGVEV